MSYDSSLAYIDWSTNKPYAHLNGLSTYVVSVTSADSPYTIVNAAVIVADAASAPINLYLSDAATTLPNQVLTIKKKDLTINDVTIYPQTGNTINGAASYLLAPGGTSVNMVHSGTDWIIMYEATSLITADVAGPVGATNDAVVRFDGATGKVVQNSVVIIDDAGAITGVASLIASGTITGSNLSGTNTGDITLTTVGATPNVNGASLVGQQLQLQPADGTRPGVLTALTQSVGGLKTFINNLAISASTASTTYLNGALISAGGAGIAGAINTNSTLFINGATDNAGAVLSPLIVKGTLSAGVQYWTSFEKSTGTYIWDVRGDSAADSLIFASSGTSKLTMTSGSKTIISDGVSAPSAAFTATTAQIALGTTNVATLTITPTASYTLTVPDTAGASSFVMTTLNQTIAGSKTFSSAISAPSAAFTDTAAQVALGTTNVATLSITPTAAYTLTIPDTAGASSFVMTTLNQSLAGVKTFTGTSTVIQGTLFQGADSATYTIPAGATMTTFGATTATLVTIATASNTAYNVVAYGVATNTTDASAAATFRLSAMIKNVAGIITTTTYDTYNIRDTSLGTATIAFTTSGTDVLIQATGIAATSIKWNARAVVTKQAY